MGGPCDILIPPAVLYRNRNGLVFEDFYNKVKEISENVGHGNISWWRKNKYLFSSQILNLPETEEFKNLEKSNFNQEFGYFRERFSELPILKVVKKKHSVIEDKFVFETYTDYIPSHHEGYSVGDYLENYEKLFWAKGVPEKYVRDDIEIRISSVVERGKPELVEYQSWKINQKLEGIPVKFEVSEEDFENEQEVSRKYSKYSLEKMFDFSISSGWLFPSSKKGTNPGLFDIGPGTFKWKRKGNKYFLDENYMLDNLSPNSVYARDSQSHWSSYSHIDLTKNWIHPSNEGVFSYTDLIMTKEAIRKKNWNILRYTGNRSKLLPFLYENSDVLYNYESAILDNELSIQAKKEGWTNSEYLRKHIEMSGKRKHLDLEIANKKLNEFRTKEFEAHKKHMERIRKEDEERKKNGEDLPF